MLHTIEQVRVMTQAATQSTFRRQGGDLAGGKSAERIAELGDALRALAEILSARQISNRFRNYMLSTDCILR